MRYLSRGTGAFIASDKNIKKFKQILKDHFHLNEETGECDFNEVYMSLFYLNSIVIFKFNNWKWYVSHARVQAIIDFINEISPDGGLIVYGEFTSMLIRYGDTEKFYSEIANGYNNESSSSINLGCPSFMKVDKTSGVRLILDGSDIESFKQKQDEF